MIDMNKVIPMVEELKEMLIASVTEFLMTVLFIELGCIALIIVLVLCGQAIKSHRRKRRKQRREKRRQELINTNKDCYI